MNFRVSLLFAPGWSLTTGSPHLAIPLLSSFLERHGIEVIARDINLESTSGLGIRINVNDIYHACVTQTLASMNDPYFKAEDKLMEYALKDSGQWNAQLGFWYEGSPEKSSKASLASLAKTSPFDSYYRNSVIPDLQHQHPDLIGFCVASVYQIIPTLQLCNLLRKEGYEGFIVLGGNTISRLVNEMAIKDIFDIVNGLIIFQGELPLLELCQTLEKGESLDRVPQLVWQDSEGNVKYNRQISSLNPNIVPTPDYRDFPIGDYWGQNYLNVVASRGCYYGKCDFCAIPYGWGNGGYSGNRSTEQIYQDLLRLMEQYGINRFKFVDEALSPHFMRSLSRRIIEDNVELEWEGYVRLEQAWCDKDFVSLIAKAGFKKGYFGLEVLPSATRPALNKHDSPNPECLLSLCASNAIKVHFFCMFGFPGSGENDARETVQFLLNNQDYIDTADIFPWTYVKHTKVKGVEPIINPYQDWSLEFNYRSQRRDVLQPEAVVELSTHYEELLWTEFPRFLHPTYRMFSPWSKRSIKQVSIQNEQTVLIPKMLA